MKENTASDSKPSAERIVVLGGLGFMGSHICRELSARGYSVRIFDKLYASRQMVADFECTVEVIEGDITRVDDVLNALGDANVLIHLIHTTVPGSSMKNPAYDVATNVISSVNWLQRLGETRIRRILYVSSGGTVYGIPQTKLISENHPTNPVSSYGITKLTIEKYVAMYASMFGLEYCLIRPSNVYGAGQRLNIGQGVIGVLADRALRGLRLELWGSGYSLRDYLHVDDMTEAVMALLAYDGPHRIFNVSSGKGHSVLDIVAILARILKPLPEIVHMPDRGFDVPINVLDSSLLCAETGWFPKVDLEIGIARTIESLRVSQKRETRK